MFTNIILEYWNEGKIKVETITNLSFVNQDYDNYCFIPPTYQSLSSCSLDIHGFELSNMANTNNFTFLD